MSYNLKEKHIKIAEEFVKEAHRNNGLAPVNIDKFWQDQEKAIKDAFAKDIPQLPLGAMPSWECVFAELGVEEDVWRYNQDTAWRLDLNRRYNDLSEKIVGRRLQNEKAPVISPDLPKIKALNTIFEMESIWDKASQSWWLNKSANTEDELKKLLDRVEKRLGNLKEFLLPEGWDKARKEMEKLGIKPPLYSSQRGPVTFAMSMYGAENIVFLILDNPPLAERLRDAIKKAMLEKIKIHWEEAGYSPDTAPHSFSAFDDNCALLNAEMYEFFGYPVLKAVFDLVSPGAKDTRYQHSDSDMEQLLPVLSKLNFTAVNFGPKVMVDKIRQHMPKTVILGQLSPLVYCRNEEVNIVAELLRDYELIGDKRGLVFTAAGGINNGSMLTGMRLLMGAIQKYCRY